MLLRRHLKREAQPPPPARSFVPIQEHLDAVKKLQIEIDRLKSGSKQSSDSDDPFPLSEKEMDNMRPIKGQDKSANPKDKTRDRKRGR